MAEFGVKIEASGFEEAEREARLVFSAAKARELSNAVYADMKEALEIHIRSDVYKAYDPKQYKRRSDDPRRGISLAESVVDDRYTKQIGPFDYTIGYAVAGLSYEPTGEHTETWRWSDTSGDELIGRIERKDPPYNWEPKKGPKIPERPFWQLFVEEMIEGGRFARVVEEELKRMGIAEPTDHITGVIRDDADGNY